MRTLVVFTDFTLKAENTAFYSLTLASHLQCDVVLCHVLTERPPQTKYSEDDKNDRVSAFSEMADLMQRLRLCTVQSEPSLYRPAIEGCIKTGLLSTALEEIATTRNIIMAVISASRADKLTLLLLGSNTRQLIDRSQYPVLLIPYEARFVGFKNLAFATDLSDANLIALDNLCDIASYADSDVVIAHVSNKGLIDYTSNTSLQNFFDRVGKQIPYPKKKYKVIKDTSVVHGLKRIPQKLNIDVLALVHKKRSFIQRLFKQSITLALTNYPTKPVMIFPPQNSQRLFLVNTH